MDEELNNYFSSVFTVENTDNMPKPQYRFVGEESDLLGQLVITPNDVIRKIDSLKTSKSPGIDGITPKLLQETKEQISIPLSIIFTQSLNEENVPDDWKEANITPIFKKGNRSKSCNYRPISLTSVLFIYLFI